MTERIYKYKIKPDDKLSSDDGTISLLNGLVITDDLSAFVEDIGDVFLVHWFWMDKVSPIHNFLYFKDCIQNILDDRIVQTREEDQEYYLISKDWSLMSEDSYDGLCDDLLTGHMVHNSRNLQKAVEVFDLEPFKKIQSKYSNKLDAPIDVDMFIVSKDEAWILIEENVKYFQNMHTDESADWALDNELEV